MQERAYSFANGVSGLAVAALGQARAAGRSCSSPGPLGAHGLAASRTLQPPGSQQMQHGLEGCKNGVCAFGTQPGELGWYLSLDRL